jgi:hypothetical protein
MKTELHYYREKAPGIAKCVEIHNSCRWSAATLKILHPIEEIINDIMSLEPGESIEIAYVGSYHNKPQMQIVVSVEIPDDDGYVLSGDTETHRDTHSV